LNIKPTPQKAAMLLGIFILFPNAFAAQNLPLKIQSAASKSTDAVVDRLTLALIDRLPSDSEREFSRARGNKGPFELADHLIKSREFFDRLSSYWSLQLRQSPAWLWEPDSELQWDRYFHSSNPVTDGKIFYFSPSQPRKDESACNGVWSIYQGHEPSTCSCDDTIDTIPYWDTSSSMRVCPVAAKPENCGPALANCVPIDARIQRTSATLEIDTDSAGGRAVTRLITDLNLAQARSIAFAAVNNRKWSTLISSPRTVLSKSSIDLMKGWIKSNPDGQIKKIVEELRLSEPFQSAKTFFLPEITAHIPRRTNRLQAENPTEELFISPTLGEGFAKQPFKLSRLQENIWDWNIQLLMTCQVPYLAQQVFNLPLPHPDSAKEGAYFCSGCHLSLNSHQPADKINNKSAQKTVLRQPEQKIEHIRECAVDHALQFVTGFRPSGNENVNLKKRGTISYQQNQENLAAVIRDIALQMALSGEK
jgi:hypothetical protein